MFQNEVHGAGYHRVSRVPGWLARGLGFGLMVLIVFSAPAAQPRRVLLLHSYGREFAPFNSFSEMFRTELAQQYGESIEFFDAALESARFEGDSTETLFTAYLEALFADRKLDLVVPIGGPAARFVQRYRGRLFPKTPMLLAAVDQRHLQPDMVDPNTAVVTVSYDLSIVIENIMQVLPGTTNIVLVTGNSPLEKFWLEEFKRQFGTKPAPLHFTWFNDLSFPEIQRRAAALPPRNAILYVLFSIDAEGVPYVEDRALGGIHSVANAPMFGLQQSQLGRGIVGGPLMPFMELSQKTANVAVRILRGEPAGSIKTPVQLPARPVFDWRELKRWGISQRRLPAGSEVRFRQSAFWERYWWQITAGIVVFAAETLLVFALLANLTRRREAEKAMRELSGRLINAQEEERARVAKELHDELSQNLALIAIEMEMSSQQLPAAAGELNARLQALSAQTQALSTEVHRISHGLHPAKLTQLGLAIAVRGFCREIEAAHNIKVSYVERQVPRNLPEDIALCLYRVSQEALHNVVKHSGAASASVQLTADGKAIELEVVDTGKGFDVNEPRVKASLGLVSMAERVRLVSGGMAIDSKPGRGTRLFVQVPLPTKTST
jgi:signal transduction histidine kinase